LLLSSDNNNDLNKQLDLKKGLHSLDFKDKFLSNIAIVRADGAILFRPRSLTSYFMWELFGSMTISGLAIGKQMCFLGYRLDVILNNSETAIESVKLCRGLMHGGGFIDWLFGETTKNFGADCFGRNWNYDCEVVIPNSIGLIEPFGQINLDEISRGKFQITSPLDFISGQVLEEMEQMYGGHSNEREFGEYEDEDEDQSE